MIYILMEINLITAHSLLLEYKPRLIPENIPYTPNNYPWAAKTTRCKLAQPKYKQMMSKKDKVSLENRDHN